VFAVETLRAIEPVVARYLARKAQRVQTTTKNPRS
jgi:hypothetical protein